MFNRALTSVNLLKNDLGGGAAAIVAAAKQNGNIKTLCGIEEGKDEASFVRQNLKVPDAVLLSFDLEFNRALISANLDYNEIGDEGATAISAALENNTTLEHLSLIPAVTKITVVGAQAIAKMLVVNRALTTLNLGSNEIGVPDGWSIERESRGRFKHYKHTGGGTQKWHPHVTDRRW